MTKFSSAFGDKYQANKKNLLIRTFELGGHTFKVRIPLVAESEAIYKKVSDPDDETIEKIYVQITASLRQFEATQAENFQFTDNDILVEGRSMREAAKTRLLQRLVLPSFLNC